MQSADKAGAGEKGWTGDELATQYLACQKSLNWYGNAFNSLAALQNHTSEGFVTVLRKAMDGVITGEYTFKELTFSSPKKTAVTTDESKFSFLGSTDPNFPVTMNGKALKLTEKGGFAVDVTLKPGKEHLHFCQQRQNRDLHGDVHPHHLEKRFTQPGHDHGGREYGGLQRHCPQGLQGDGGIQRKNLHHEGLASEGRGGCGRSGAF